MTEPGLTYGRWRKSSHSGGGTHGDCVEVAAVWRKSSHSDGGTHGDCVEVAPQAAWGGQRMIGIRDSKNPGGPVLSMSAAEWSALLRGLKQQAPA